MRRSTSRVGGTHELPGTTAELTDLGAQPGNLEAGLTTSLITTIYAPVP
jgi:hypothetical protein